MDWWILLAVGLYVICAILLILEVFVPSGGILGICALACLIGGLTLFFRNSQTAGWIGIVVAIILIPVVLIGAYKVFPKTKLGKSFILQTPTPQPGSGIADLDSLNKLVGAEGVTTTILRPVGVCEFAGHRVECVAEGGYVEKNKKVKVLNIEGTQVTVRVIEET
jgi:membrane-bound serine protease (ClpP class)